MNETLYAHANEIARRAIAAVLPDEAVRRALAGRAFPGGVFLVAAGKAAWRMADAAVSCLPPLAGGVVITKDGHARGPIPGCECFEAGHPVPDARGFAATRRALSLVSGLAPEDTVVFLLSGGGSALFELPLIPGEELQRITAHLLASGADIGEINTVRKRLSAVKGGRFALRCRPARVLSILLSDVLGDAPDRIASGPAYPDPTTCADALRVCARYGLRLSDEARACLAQETPKALDRVETRVEGSVSALCRAAGEAARALGYTPVFLTDRLCCQAREAGSFLASILRSHAGGGDSLAFIAGGETVVRVTGRGLGGRNQELTLAAAEGIAGLPGAAVFSVGSDGTDGPTDAAGGYADGDTVPALAAAGLSIRDALADNDAYHALSRVGGLIVTGPTGTNVNDVAVALLRKEGCR